MKRFFILALALVVSASFLTVDAGKKDKKKKKAEVVQEVVLCQLCSWCSHDEWTDTLPEAAVSV